MDKDLSNILRKHGLSSQLILELESQLQRLFWPAVIFKDFDKNFDDFQEQAKSFQEKKQKCEASIKRSISIITKHLGQMIKLGKWLDDYPKLVQKTKITPSKIENPIANLTEKIQLAQLALNSFKETSAYLSSFSSIDIGKLRLSSRARTTDEISCSEYYKYRPKDFLTEQDLAAFKKIAKLLLHWVSFGSQYVKEDEFGFSKNQLPLKRTAGGSLDHQWWHRMEREFDAVLYKHKVPPKVSARIIIDIAKLLGYPNKYLHKELTVYKRILESRRKANAQKP